LISGHLGAFSQALAAKTMLLIAAAPRETFLLGDTPVTLANQTDADLQGNLGLEVEGIEIYLPIAPDLTLAFWCPSLVGVLQTCFTQCDTSLRKTAAATLFGVGPEADTLREMQADLRVRKARVGGDLAAIQAGTPIASDHCNMEYYNSLQVVHAERYLLSATGDFGFVQQMLDASASARRGLRSELV
jgi:hypothetical protein